MLKFIVLVAVIATLSADLAAASCATGETQTYAKATGFSLNDRVIIQFRATDGSFVSTSVDLHGGDLAGACLNSSMLSSGSYYVSYWMTNNGDAYTVNVTAGSYSTTYSNPASFGSYYQITASGTTVSLKAVSTACPYGMLLIHDSQPSPVITYQYLTRGNRTRRSMVDSNFVTTIGGTTRADLCFPPGFYSVSHMDSANSGKDGSFNLTDHSGANQLTITQLKYTQESFFRIQKDLTVTFYGAGGSQMLNDQDAERHLSCDQYSQNMAIQIVPDGIPNDEFWFLQTTSGKYIAQGGVGIYSVCLDKGNYTFRIADCSLDRGTWLPGTNNDGVLFNASVAQQSVISSSSASIYSAYVTFYVNATTRPASSGGSGSSGSSGDTSDSGSSGSTGSTGSTSSTSHHSPAASLVLNAVYVLVLSFGLLSMLAW